MNPSERPREPSVHKYGPHESHGARTKKIARNSYDGLPAYGTSSDMRRSDILGRIDELIEERRLLTTDGPYPVLRPAPAIAAA